MPVTHVLYLHGFRSSPMSAKARRMAAWVQAERPDLTWWCPQLPEEHKLQYVAEFTSDGVNWQPGTVSRAFGEAGALVRCTATDPASPVAGERRFGRVRVTGLP